MVAHTEQRAAGSRYQSTARLQTPKPKEHLMSKLITSLAAASFVAFGATALMAQSQSEPPKAPASSGEVKQEKPTDPNQKAPSEAEKLLKDEKAGNKSTGG
jgi:hypothetical protein